jgi:drug/metabolite transporter (DMT)-like permease
VAVFLGILVAMSFGAGDFAGGRASMRAPTSAVLFVSQIVAVAGALVVALVVGARVAPHDIWFGIAAGCVNIVGLGLLYRGLATAAMGVVAPVTAVLGATVPVAWGLTRGERPSALALAGILLAITAATLLAYEPGPERGRLAPGVAIAVAAGTLLGSSLVLYSETSNASGLWPVFAARAVALMLIAVAWFAWFARRGARLPVGLPRRLALVAGGFDVTATALVLIAVRKGLVSIVAGVAALAPGFTVVLAWVVLRQHLTVRQRCALVVALVGLVLVATG